MTKNRRGSRELALKVLFFMDMQQNFSEDQLELFCDNFKHESKQKFSSFFLKIVKGVIDYRAELDSLIEKYSRNWKLSRMSCVDRNIMRIAAYEMLYCDDIPLKVSINEAIDIGKDFGTDESGAFINGILDSIRLTCEGGKSCDN